MKTSSFSQIDHLIFGVPDLQSGIDLIESKLGERPTTGGQHPDFGTHNALLKIGARTYFELIAPDPDLVHLNRPLWMGLDQLSAPGLIWWAAKAGNLDLSRERARTRGWELGEVMAGNRKLPDGTTLNWQLTDPFKVQEGGILPFLIDWGSGPHPTDQITASCRLIDFQLFHPAPEKIRRYLSAIDLKISVNYSDRPGMKAAFTTSKGTVYL